VHKYLTALATATLLFCSTSANALIYKFDFLASGFNQTSPESSISGSFIIRADGPGLAPKSISDVELTIGGYSYALSDIKFSNYGSWFSIGAGTDPDVLYSNTNDFSLYSPSTGSYGFLYTTQSTGGAWFAPSVSVTYTQIVPEPETYAMLLAGLCMLGFVARRRSGTPLI
jgi:hypothetical protein